MENYDIEEVLDFFETKILYSVERVVYIDDSLIHEYKTILFTAIFNWSHLDLYQPL